MFHLSPTSHLEDRCTRGLRALTGILVRPRPVGRAPNAMEEAARDGRLAGALGIGDHLEPLRSSNEFTPQWGGGGSASRERSASAKRPSPLAGD